MILFLINIKSTNWLGKKGNILTTKSWSLVLYWLISAASSGPCMSTGLYIIITLPPPSALLCVCVLDMPVIAAQLARHVEIVIKSRITENFPSSSKAVSGSNKSVSTRDKLTLSWKVTGSWREFSVKSDVKIYNTHEIYDTLFICDIIVFYKRKVGGIFFSFFCHSLQFPGCQPGKSGLVLQTHWET